MNDASANVDGLAADIKDRTELAKSLRAAADALEYANGYIESQQETIDALFANRVPREPTAAMIDAALRVWEPCNFERNEIADFWRAMYGAAVAERAELEKP